MPYTADAIANFFLDKAQSARKTLTQIQIQKLVFYAHGWYLALDREGRPLVGEMAEAWRLGPVFRSLYREFEDCGKGPITQKAKEMRFEKTEERGLTFSFFEPSIDEERPDDIDRELAMAVLRRVWDIYGKFTAYQLSNMTHSEGEPWRIIRDAMPTPFPKGLHIPNETIRECFRNKLKPLPPA